jgi:hypothetical protein
MRGRDPQGFYEALNIEPGASQEDVYLAYHFLKKKQGDGVEAPEMERINAAYAALCDPQRRAAYDAQVVVGGTGRRMQAPTLVALLLVGQIAALGFMCGPDLKAKMTRFEPGEVLVLKSTEDFFGTVRLYDPAHAFHNGAVAAAYLIEADPRQRGEWYPAGDLARICKRR